MAQINFFFADSEMHRLVEYLVGERYGLVPNLKYAQRKYETYCDAEKSVRCRREQKPLLWFLIRDDYSRFLPLPMDRLQGGVNDGKYWILQKEDGPTIDLSWSGEYRSENKLIIIPGSLSHHASFWNTYAQVELRTSDELRSAYAELVKWIKSNSIRSEQPKGELGAWIGPEAAKAWKRGAQLGHPPFLRRPKFVPDDETSP